MLKSSWHPQKWYGIPDAYRAIRGRCRDKPIWLKFRGVLLSELLEFARERGDKDWHQFNLCGDLRRTGNYYSFPCPPHADRFIWSRRMGVLHCSMIQMEDFADWFTARRECFACNAPAATDIDWLGEFVCRDCAGHSWRLGPEIGLEAVKCAIVAGRVSEMIVEELHGRGVPYGVDRAIDAGVLPFGYRSKFKPKQAIAQPTRCDSGHT